MSNEDHKVEKQRGSAEAGLVYFGAVLTGYAGIAASVTAFFNMELEGGGIYLLASALVFGLLANAMFRN